MSIAAGLALSGARAAPPPPPADVLPDLVADPVEDVELTTDSSGAAPRLLLRFAGYLHNAGQGPAEIRGTRPSVNKAMSVSQRIFDTADGSRDVPSPGELTFEIGDGHHHWHLAHAARYSLWNSARSAETAPAMKVGFCLEDTEKVDSHGPPAQVYGGSRNHLFCEQWHPDVLSVFQGVSPGWRDVYSKVVAFQWVDASAVQPGSYWLRSDVDPDDVVVESAEVNQPAWAGAATTIPGYVAQAADGGDIPAGVPSIVALGAERFGDPGAALYRVESAPAHGTLDLAAGASRGSGSVVYTPDPGFRGVDSFTYSVRDATSAFPLSPATATATVRVAAAPTPTVRIDGAPEAVVAGTSVQLRATVTNDAPGLTWSVDGAAGGDAAHGTIAPDGLFRAPARPPVAGAVTIAARSAGGGFDSRRVRIDPVPVARPAPLPSETSRSRGRLSRPQVARIGRRLIVSTFPARAGAVRLRAYSGRRKLGSCSALTPGGRRFTCRLRIPRKVSVTARIGIVASLRVNGRVIAVKRLRPTRVRAPHGH